MGDHRRSDCRGRGDDSYHSSPEETGDAADCDLEKRSPHGQWAHNDAADDAADQRHGQAKAIRPDSVQPHGPHAGRGRDSLPGMRHFMFMGGQSKVDESYSEHQRIKDLLNDLATIDPSGYAFDAKLADLKKIIQHHVEEEEEEMFPC
jgi:hemerythrin HHE cation binding domain-containing protein